MRWMPDSELDDIHGVDVLQDFEPMLLELDAREMSEGANEADRDSVWLECNGELLDAASVNPVEVRNSACGFTCGFKTLRFICPRCNEPHESVRFR